jgi:hypothetical protein
MIRSLFIQGCALLIAVSSAALAVGQYNTYGQATLPAPVQTNAFNPFVSLPGFAGQQLSQLYNQNVSTRTPSLNQLALRNAQAITQNSMQQQTASMGTARIGLGTNTSYSGTKPYSNYSTGPSVSPYLNLFRNDLNGQNQFNYSTLVEPQLQQQQMNQQLSRQTSSNERRLQSIAAQSDYNPQGDRNEAPTGHQTVFQYFGHYYQQTPHHKPQGRMQ